ncbi:tyrosine-protein phosphatase [Alkalibacillus silvisoli]|uniref:Tyrosine-protein phosphatase n=1 Tax=Alkalibacillus silvisoli TaxID=392823 RepID=A0ABP3K1F1_9BACI
MIDIHSHILPNVDDGASTLDDSIQMAKAAQSEGITTIYATPHHLNGRYETSPSLIKDKVSELNRELENRQINLKVKEGQEIRVNGEIPELLEDGEAIPLGNDSKYVLIEFPSSQVPRYAKQTSYDMQRMGYQPIIVHPERNSAISKYPNILYEQVKRGALTQLTASSVAGKFGKKIQALCFDLIEANLVHFIASDAHNTSSRGFHMKEAFDILEDRYGAGLVELFKENAETAATGEPVICDPPMEVKKKKKLLGIF